ncbi:hypothetical protein GYN07_09035 [Rhizobium leguminosarum bv. viciae 248]|uniref:hypothetical protein n=1 Tax=Rhizobium leguminosarum TaxID=384 RepID=UPI0003706530|nr:hypothetical protein [Rhizobium leguminosarum]QHW24462.1 hypothetical protein GYN07_09035 [Rhizobium leguminosarum bv. viciae 248]
MVPEFPSRIARVGAIVTLLGSLIWIQWPIDFEKFDAAAFILLIGSLVSWVGIELADYQKSEAFSRKAVSQDPDLNDNAKSEDVNKVNSLLKMIDKRQFYTLKEKAIQTYMREDDYDGLSQLVNYHESDIFPFHSQNIQSLYQGFSTGAREFYFQFFSLYSSDGRGHATWKPLSGGWLPDEQYKEVMAKIATLDRLASELSKIWEELIRVSLQELKGASKAIERYDM